LTVVGVRLEEGDVADADGVQPHDRAGDPGHPVRVPAAIEGRPRVVDVDAVEGGGEVVAVGLSEAAGELWPVDQPVRLGVVADQEVGRMGSEEAVLVTLVSVPPSCSPGWTAPRSILDRLGNTLPPGRLTGEVVTSERG
jgi:hypothetical protein